MSLSKEEKNARRAANARKHYATPEGREKHNARVRRWRKANPGASRKIQRWSHYGKHGILPTREEPKWCECCGRPPETALCFDHDHTTLKFRGWLCRPCNSAIGQLGDSTEGVEKALAYLKRAT
jgi:hypothetical protein